MTASITCLRTRQPITQPDIVALPPVYVLSQMPGWVTSHPVVAAVVRWLEMHNWHVEPSPCKIFFCWHQKIVRVNGTPFSLPDAYVLQCEINGVRPEYGVLKDLLAVFEGFRKEGNG